MKKSNSLLQASLMFCILLTITGCNLSQQSVTKLVSATPQSPSELPSATLASPSATPNSNYLPYIFSLPVTRDPAATSPAYPPPGADLSTATPSLSPTPSPTSKGTTKAPTPTLFWPTQRPGETATAFVPPKGDHGQTLPPEKWQSWPVIPVVSIRAKQIYQAGLNQGNDPKRFSKVGDCQNIRQYFLGIYDDSTSYSLGKHPELVGAINQFSGSWHRLSEAVHTGFNVASVLTPLYANPATCTQGESPLACEIRIWHPSIVIISMETWTTGRPTTTYEGYLRQIVEYALSRNILPIVATKADNLEGDNSINLAVARVAAAYDIPLWNFWRAAQALPSHGLTGDNFHLTNAPNQFDNPKDMEFGWPVRNLTALQVLDTVWKAVK